MNPNPPEETPDPDSTPAFVPMEYAEQRKGLGKIFAFLLVPPVLIVLSCLIELQFVAVVVGVLSPFFTALSAGRWAANLYPPGAKKVLAYLGFALLFAIAAIGLNAAGCGWGMSQ